MDVFGKKTHPVLEYDKVPKLQRHSTPEFYGQFFFCKFGSLVPHEIRVSYFERTCWYPEFFQKNERKNLTYNTKIPQVDLFLFVCLEELKTPESLFEKGLMLNLVKPYKILAHSNNFFFYEFFKRKLYFKFKGDNSEEIMKIKLV